MTRGWGGDPPRDDDEARARVLDAAMRCVQRHGTKTGLADVARELGVTRQTVYRLYPSVEALLVAVGVAGAEAYLDRLTRHVADLDDPAEIVVESMLHTFERLPHEPALGLLLAAGRRDLFARTVTSPGSMAFARSMLDRVPVDWEAHGYGEEDLEGLAEFGLRLLQSLVLDPPVNRGRDDVRAWLYRWMAPALRPAASVGGAR